jgi:hypothetical protein
MCKHKIKGLKRLRRLSWDIPSDRSGQLTIKREYCRLADETPIHRHANVWRTA